jgi:hypothetical protein
MELATLATGPVRAAVIVVLVCTPLCFLVRYLLLLQPPCSLELHSRVSAVVKNEPAIDDVV